MNAKIDNLVKYFIGLFGNNDIKGTNFSQMVNKKTIDIKEDEFKKLIVNFLEDKINIGNSDNIGVYSSSKNFILNLPFIS